MALGKSVCVVCRQERDGVPVEDDPVIAAIRAVKTRLGIATGNRLVVCHEDLETARKKRARFERTLMWCAMLGAAFIFVILLSKQSLASLFIGLVVAAVVVSFALLAYFPKACGTGIAAVSAAPAGATHKRVRPPKR